MGCGEREAREEESGRSQMPRGKGVLEKGGNSDELGRDLRLDQEEGLVCLDLKGFRERRR